jgi:CBS domain-containing protein
METLSDVMTRDLVTVAPATTVAEAATLMSTRHVGSVLVMDGDRLSGIFTERDIVRALAGDFDASGHEVGAWMTSDPVSATPATTASEALESMLSRGFRHLPVVDDGRVTGIVSIRDVTPRV